ncbi:unnamed protein product [Prorocentrum cordatum]|uniref:Uncharacterized protein n=1 Tax=Prorocentrum cordatum TaxID=2364126 RepID=A0ABN9YGD7_9DINO|nr:unnamed protein product [Polarella glacialis]
MCGDRCMPIFDTMPAGEESNMMMYLAVVENEVSKLLKIYDAIRDEDDAETTRPVRPAGASTNFQIKLPSTVEDYSEDEDDDDEDDQRPFTRDELKIKEGGRKSSKKHEETRSRAT